MNGIDLNANTNIIPDDLDASSVPVMAPTEATTARFDFSKYKNWIILLVLTIVIFVGIIVAINYNNSKVEQQLEPKDKVAKTNTDEIPSFFTASLLGLENEAPTNVEDSSVVGTETLINPPEPENVNPVLDDFAFPADFNFDRVPVIDDGSATNSGESIADLLGSADLGATTTVSPEAQENLGLNSNTMPEVLSSGQMEGDTGPALWITLIPTLAYGLIKVRKT